MQINGAAAVVTGGASGLGEATVRRLAAAGADVTILDKNAEKGEALAKELGGAAKRTIARDGTPHDLEIFKFVVNINLIGTFNVIRLAASAISKADPLENG